MKGGKYWTDKFIMQTLKKLESITNRVTSVKYDRLLPFQRNVYLFLSYKEAVSNSRHAGFFSSVQGKRAIETLDALKAMGVPAAEKVLRKALAQLPDGFTSASSAERKKIVKSLPPLALKKLEALDEKLYEIDDAMIMRMLEYWKENSR